MPFILIALGFITIVYNIAREYDVPDYATLVGYANSAMVGAWLLAGGILWLTLRRRGDR